MATDKSRATETEKQRQLQLLPCFTRQLMKQLHLPMSKGQTSESREFDIFLFC